MALSLKFGIPPNPNLTCKRNYRPLVRCMAIASPKISKLSSYYDTLSLKSSEKLGMEDIKKAYRTMALRYHPDVCDPSMRLECTRKFVELNKAYRALSDSKLGEMYDLDMAVMDGFDEEENMRRVWTAQIVGLERRSKDRAARRNARNRGQGMPHS
ncbi:hypothetical protein AMTR_s00010p00207190 [Amborella trichopoda]|uniref:J domain-containing protein n=2 Tax=Amborella trichopoda TaxID=13333 RepID=W1NFJ9_AMBTC|nr:hypothetical protein AMTR_s00010p00207190 [Amborella trichopoda]